MRKVRSIAGTLTVLTVLLAPVAAGAAQDTARPEPNPSNQGITTGVTTVRELPGLRSADSDTYLQSDGSRLLQIADHPINYKRDGVWQPIEDKLIEDSDGSWGPVASPVPVSLPRALAGNAVKIGAAASQISLSLQGATASTGIASGNARTYLQALAGVDVEYAGTPDGVRETLTLADASAPSEYKYALGLSEGMHATRNPGGSISILGSRGSIVYTIAAPSVSDSAGPAQLPSAAHPRYELNAAGTELTLLLDKSWLRSPARVFPVRIDPDVYFGALKDCTIANNSYENTELCGERLYIGHSTESNTTGRALIQFDLSSVPRGSQILSSSLAMWLASTSTATPVEVEAYGLSKEFTSDATWNDYDGTHAWTTPGGDHLKPLAGTSVVKSEYAGGWVSIGFSPQIEQWVRDPTANFGILLKAHDETANATDEIIQTDNGKGEPEPNINIVYEPQMGNPPNQAMFQEPIGNNGTLAVNVANGNLHITDPDVNYATEGYDTQLARSYNSYDDELVGSALGNRWRLNMGEDELLYPAWWDGSNALHEPDGSYTRFDRAAWADNHPAAGDKAYTGDAYRPETLIVHENGTRTLTDDETGVEWQFDNSGNGFPQKIVAPSGEGNTISLSYTSSRLTKVTDTHSHALTLTRSATTHYVTKIKGASAGEEWIYTYTEGLLTRYQGPGGQEAKYTYGGPYSRLESVTDPSGTTVITYDEQARVSSLRHIVNGTIKIAGSEDEITTFSYETEQTTVTHPNAGTDIYHYDEFGNIVEDPAAQEAASEFYAAYSEIEPLSAQKDVDLQDHAAILDSQLGQQLGEAYVGEWFSAATGKIQIGMTSEGYEQTVEADLDNLGLADNAEIVTATTSGASLEAGEATISTDLAKLIKEQLVVIGAEFSADHVTVETANALTSAQKAEVAAAVAGAGVPVSVTEGTEATIGAEPTSCSAGACTAPLRGGVKIARPETFPGVACTAGFITRSRANNKPYLLTAGHCIYEGGGNGKEWASEFPGDVLANDRSIGKSYSYVYGSSFKGVPGGTTSDGDAGLIEIAPSSVFSKDIAPYVIQYGNTAFGVARNERYLITKPHYSPQGHERKEQFVVCLAGTHEGEQFERCGFTRGYAYEVSTKTTVEHNLEQFWQCDPAITSGAPNGTSGAPVYKNHEALGIYVAKKIGQSCLGYYEGINTAENVLGVRIVTG
jgi:TGF-beta propeptide